MRGHFCVLLVPFPCVASFLNSSWIEFRGRSHLEPRVLCFCGYFAGNSMIFGRLPCRLLALGLQEFNSDWERIQQRFLPTKTPHQIAVRVKNRCSNHAPDNVIKQIRYRKVSPPRWGTDQEMPACLHPVQLAPEGFGDWKAARTFEPNRRVRDFCGADPEGVFWKSFLKICV